MFIHQQLVAGNSTPFFVVVVLNSHPTNREGTIDFLFFFQKEERRRVIPVSNIAKIGRTLLWNAKLKEKEEKKTTSGGG